MAFGLGVILAVAAFIALGWTLGSSHATKAHQADLDRSAKIIKDQAVATAEAQGKIDAMAEQLRAKTVLREQEKSGTKEQIVRTASVSSSCLSPATARVLRSAIARANERLAQSQNPGVATATAAPIAPVAADAQEADEDAGASEQATGVWAAGTIADYEAISEQLLMFQSIARSSPNVIIVKDK